MNEAYDDLDGLRARSEQAIGEFAQALLDSQVLENAAVHTPPGQSSKFSQR